MNGFMERLKERWRRGQRGQMLIIFALVIVPVSLVVGVMAVDVSAFQSERRGAQKDADLAALAGAWELLRPTPIAADAIAAVNESRGINDQQGNASLANPIQVDSSCFGTGSRLDSVIVNINHASRSFFAQAFGIFGLPGGKQVGAHARACAGSVISATGLRPWGIESQPQCTGAYAYPAATDERYVSIQPFAKKTDTPTSTPAPPTNTPTKTPTRTATPTPGGPTNTPASGTPTATPACTLPKASDGVCFVYDSARGINLPRFGEWCILDDGSSDPSTSKRGLLDLSLSGAICSDGGRDDVDTNIQNGSGATCKIGDTVIPVTGARPGQDINKGVQVLLAGGGTPPVADGAECDAKFRDPAGKAGMDDFTEVLERIDGGPPGPSPDAVYQLRACTSPRVVNLIVVGNLQTDPTIKAFAAFYILGCADSKDPLAQQKATLPNRCGSGAPGQANLWGIFFNKVELGGDIGEFNPYGDNKIGLTE